MLRNEAGKIHALRPAFRDLGLPAAFVYEALEHAKTAPSSFDVAQQSGLARSTVYSALQVLAAVDLVTQRGGLNAESPRPAGRAWISLDDANANGIISTGGCQTHLAVLNVAECSSLPDTTISHTGVSSLSGASWFTTVLVCSR